MSQVVKALYSLSLFVFLFSKEAASLAAGETQSKARFSERAATELSETKSTERFNKEQWGLDESEWKRYQTLIQGIRGSISPATLSPIEVLGIHARDDAERKDYARRWAKLMKEDTERILAFQASYNDAWRELNPSGQIINLEQVKKLIGNHFPSDWAQPGDRLLLFMPIDCVSCDEYLRAAREASSKSDVQVDIYITGTVSDEAILKWARSQGFNPEAIKAKKITFNHEKGELGTVAGLAATIPKLVRLRNQTAAIIDPLLPQTQ